MPLRLEDLKPEAQVTGLIGREDVRIVSAQMMGEACDMVFRDGQGNLQFQILFRDREADLDLVAGGRKWSSQGDGDKFRLVSEGERIRLAYLFDPYVALSSSAIDPLPHQISAVFEHMLPRQPMRYLLADDPGAGKTIMAGLLITELLIRGELERYLIVAPGSLSEQWQDELKEKFELLTRDLINATGLGNPFAEKSLLIARMDMLSRDQELQTRLEQAPEWDLVVCDESHRMSAHYFGGDFKPTKRYQMGQWVGNHIRSLFMALPLLAILLQSCGTPQSRGIATLLGKRDACSYIHGQQYPYDWEGSNVGACVRKLPPQAQTVMVPDPIGGLFQVPQTVMNDNIWSISSPVGQGVGEFNGKYVVGVISTSQGDAEFVCAGVAVTGSSRGICGLR